MVPALQHGGVQGMRETSWKNPSVDATHTSSLPFPPPRLPVNWTELPSTVHIKDLESLAATLRQDIKPVVELVPSPISGTRLGWMEHCEMTNI